MIISAGNHSNFKIRKELFYILRLLLRLLELVCIMFLSHISMQTSHISCPSSLTATRGHHMGLCRPTQCLWAIQELTGQLKTKILGVEPRLT